MEAKEKYGLVEDLDKFIETEGTEGLADGGIEQDPPAQDPPAQDPPAQDPPAQVNVLETQEYKDLLEKAQKLEDSLKTKSDVRPELKEIQDWAERTNRPIEDWIKFSKDISKLSDKDIVRETQRMKTDLTEDEIEFYIKDKFVSDEFDSDEDKMRKGIAFKQAVREGRKMLEDNKLSFNTPSDAMLTKEQKEDLALAAKFKETSSSQLKEGEIFNERINSVISKTESLKLSFGEDRSIDFKIPAEDKKSHAEYIDNVPSWVNEDGSRNHQNILDDSYKIKYFDKILDLVYKQGINDQVDKSAKESRHVQTDPPVHGTDAGNSKYGLVHDGRAKRRYQV